MSPAAPDRTSRPRIGARIRRLRTAAGLRQWQLASLIGTTQPSVCMYERGVLPDPARLLRIARIGGTTVEWILTGRHWEGGSEEMEPAPPALFGLASLFHRVGEQERSTLFDALEVIRVALSFTDGSDVDRVDGLDVPSIVRRLEGLSRADRGALRAALALHDGVCRALLSRGMRSLMPPTPADGTSPGRSRPFVSSKGVELLKGPLFRVEPGLLVLEEILREPALRAELERALERLSRRLRGRGRAGRTVAGRRAGPGG